MKGNSPRNVYLSPSGFFVSRLNKLTSTAKDKNLSPADLGVLLIGSQSFAESNKFLLEALDESDPSLANILRSEGLRFDDIVRGLRDLVTTLHAEISLINDWREENNTMIDQKIREIKTEAEKRLSDYEKQYEAVHGAALQADIKVRMLEKKLEALKKVERKPLEMLAKEAKIPAPPKKHKYWTIVTNTAAVGSGIVIGLSLVKQGFNLDLSLLDAGSILLLLGGAVLGSGIGLGAKWGFEYLFGLAAWTFHCRQQFAWYLAVASLAVIGFVALDVMLFKSALNSISFFQDFASETTLESRDASSWAISMAVTVPMSMMAAVSGWIFNWADHREAFLKAEQEAEQGERTDFNQIAKLEEELATTKGIRDGLWEERARRAADLNNHDTEVAIQIEELDAKREPYISDFSDEQLAMIDRAILAAIEELRKLNELTDATKFDLASSTTKEILARRIEPSTGGVKAKFGRWLKGVE